MISSSTFSALFVGLLVLKTAVEFYLSWRNSTYVWNHRQQVPERFQSSITLADHQKAASYTTAKASFGRLEHIFSAMILVAWILGGGLDFLSQYFAGVENEIVRGLALMFSVSFISSFLDLPWNLYQTFVLEEKFGFNKTTVKTFIKDLFKQMFLGLLIGIPMLSVLLWVMRELGGNWWWVAWLLMVGFQFLMMWAWPRFLAPLFNKFTPLPEGELKQKIESLLARCDFRSSGLFVMNASLRSAHGNAYFTGLGKSKRIVFFDTLINTLTPSEVEAVLAHELGHFKLKHILKSMIRSTLLSFLGFWILGQLLKMDSFYLAHHVNTPSPAVGLLLFSMVIPLYTFFLAPIFSWYSRKHEFEADDFAKKYSQAQDLASALVKMYRDNASTLTPDPLYSAFYYSHPPALERIEHLGK